MTQWPAFVVCADGDRMPTARLTSRQVAVGQSTSPCFRRVFSPVACAGNERSSRSQLFSRTRLRDCSKLNNTLVVSRSDSSHGERETHSETMALLREKQKSEAETDIEGQSSTVLPTKTFHFDSPSDDEMPTEKEEAPTSETRPSDQEEVDTRSNTDGQIITKTADIIVAKRPSKPSLSKLVSMRRAKNAARPVPQDSAALQNALMPESGAVQNSATQERPPKVIVAKRKPQSLGEKASVMSNPTVIKRVEDVLVVQKSSASNAASQQLPPQNLSNGKEAILEGKRPPRTEKNPVVQPPIASTEEKKNVPKSEGGRVIERPRPKNLMPRPSTKRPQLKIQKPTERARMEVAEVLLTRRTRIAKQHERNSLQKSRSEQNRLTPLGGSRVQDSPPALGKESAADAAKRANSDSVVQNIFGERLSEEDLDETEGGKDSARQGSDVRQSSDDTKDVTNIRTELLKSAHMLYREKEGSEDSEVTSDREQVNLTSPTPVRGSGGPPSTVRPLDGKQGRQSTRPSNQTPQAPPPAKKVQLVKKPSRPGTSAAKPQLSRKSPAKPATNKTSTYDIDFDRQFMKNKAEKAKERLRDERRKQHQQEREERSPKKEKPSSEEEYIRTDMNLIDSRRKARTERQGERGKDSRGQIEREMIIEVGAEGLSVEELAGLLAADPTEVMKILFVKGIMIAVNQTLDTESVKAVAAELGVEVLDKTEADVTEMAKKEESFCEDEEQSAMTRPPVVTVMGHVDHGKTSLLDHIRRTRVVDGEAGGITQAIGAYTCEVEVEGQKRSICFLDTPGHEAFSAMRARGTRVTDIAIIVIAANDGIRPQTLEAISHAKAAEVPIVIAINKIDMVGADPERVKRELSEIELLPEEWGGKTPVVCISAKKGDSKSARLVMNSTNRSAFRCAGSVGDDYIGVGHSIRSESESRGVGQRNGH